MFTFKHCANKAGVKESTARFYKDTFREFFKTYGTGSHVTYDPETIDILSFIAQRYSEGLSRDDVRAALREKFGIPVSQEQESLVDITQYQKEFANLISGEVRNQVGQDLKSFLNALEQKFDEKYLSTIKEQQEKIENQSIQITEQSKQINDLSSQVEHLKNELKDTNNLIGNSNSNLAKLRQDIEQRDNEIMANIREKQELAKYEIIQDMKNYQNKSLFQKIKEKLGLNNEQKGVSKETKDFIVKRNNSVDGHNNNADE